MSENMIVGKSTVLLLSILALALLFLPATHNEGSVITLIFPDAFGQIPVLNITQQVDAPPDPKCFELGTCDVFASPLDAMLEPFFCAFSFEQEPTVDGSCATGSGQFFLIVIWGLIIGIIWLRTSSTMITGVVGIGVATLFTFNEKTILVGIVLLGAAIGIVVYQLYKQRLDFPTN